MTPDGGADLEAIRERAAFDFLPREERFAILRAEIAAMSDDEWFSEADKPIQRRAVACREDRARLLTLIDEQQEALRAALPMLGAACERAACSCSGLTDDDCVWDRAARLLEDGS